MLRIGRAQHKIHIGTHNPKNVIENTIRAKSFRENINWTLKFAKYKSENTQREIHVRKCYSENTMRKIQIGKTQIGNSDIPFGNK